MNLCHRGHEEVCHELNTCPVCDAIKEKNKRIEQLENDLKDSQREVDELIAQVAKLEQGA